MSTRTVKLPRVDYLAGLGAAVEHEGDQGVGFTAPMKEVKRVSEGRLRTPVRRAIIGAVSS